MSNDPLTNVAELPLRPEPPDDLPAVGKRLWRAIVKDYDPRHFKGANLALLAQLCRAHGFAAQCERHIRKHGVVIRGRANPSVAMRAQAWMEVRACTTKLRLSISGLQRADAASVRPNEKHGLRKPWEQ